MKRAISILSVTAILFAGGLRLTKAQEQPKPKKDTVNMDTYAKPVFYYAEEEKKSTTKGSSAPTIAIIGGIIVIAGAVVYILLRRKKQ